MMQRIFFKGVNLLQIRNSQTSYIQYSPAGGSLLFKNEDGNGGLYTTDKCFWSVEKFYISHDFKLISSCISFENKKICKAGEKLSITNPVERGVIFLSAGDESFVDFYIFNLRDSVEDYSFDDVLLEVNLSDEQTQGLIGLINNGLWDKLKLTIFINEYFLLNAIEGAKEKNYYNFSFRISDYSLSL